MLDWLADQGWTARTKLVRDRVPDIPWPHSYKGMPCGDALKVYLGTVEPGTPGHRELLRDKLVEELQELLDAFDHGTREEVVEEVGDLLEVFAAMLWFDGTVPTKGPDHRLVAQRLEPALDAADRKRVERGGLYLGVTYCGPRPAR
jgi:predicted house-cleaning noncanonical NTP pyrophosphatase (MazG superfamily)